MGDGDSCEISPNRYFEMVHIFLKHGLSLQFFEKVYSACNLLYTFSLAFGSIFPRADFTVANVAHSSHTQQWFCTISNFSRLIFHELPYFP